MVATAFLLVIFALIGAPLFTVIAGPTAEISAGGKFKKELAEKDKKRYKFFEQLLEKSDRPTALFVTNNQMTLGALYALKQKKLRWLYWRMPWDGRERITIFCPRDLKVLLISKRIPDPDYWWGPCEAISVVLLSSRAWNCCLATSCAWVTKMMPGIKHST